MAENDFTIRRDVDLAPFNTLDVHANASYFVQIDSVPSLKSLLKTPRWQNERKFILGGGSNVLFIDDFEGLVIHIAITGKRIIKKDKNFSWLTIGAGENWHNLVRYCVERGWGGLENLSLIPGSVGAAPVQNIGAYGAELRDVFESLTAVNVQTGVERNFSKSECRFGYRSSIFKRKLKNWFVITDVTLKLSLHPETNTSYGAIEAWLSKNKISSPTISDVSDAVIEIRNAKLPDPSELANAGSFFKNPVIDNELFKKLKKKYSSIPGYPAGNSKTKVPAGWLIEQTGWKGKTVGNVGTFCRQALVIVNHGGAAGQEILQVAEKIQHSVEEKFGIKLVPEVNVVE
jgi:UDP-N-acetylmuramate dehydrogenase